jgi:hypothetical protein
MTHIAQRLAEELAVLSAEDRAELAHFLITSVEDPAANEAYRAEIAERVADVESGREVGYDAKEFLANLRRKYAG